MIPRVVRTTTIAVVLLSVVVFSIVFLSPFHPAVSGGAGGNLSTPIYPPLAFTKPHDHPNLAIREDHPYQNQNPNRLPNENNPSSFIVGADSILLPDWEVLFVAPPGIDPPSGNYSCVFPHNQISPAKRGWNFPSTNQTTFICVLPVRNRRRKAFPHPVLTAFPANVSAPPQGAGVEQRELIRWSFMTYGSFSTENDVVVFSKGVNHQQGINRPSSEVTCVFFTKNGVVRTPVTASAQEVFRCPHPAAPGDEKIKISLEISGGETNYALLVPSVAQYTPWRRAAGDEEKALLCACTMVYNVAKFLREWVMYHSAIGIEKFILYDNGSDDDLEKTVQKLNEEGNYDIKTVFWPWPKTQEAGFSHCAVAARDSCTWMTYVDVDEFIFSPKWLNSSNPSKQMLDSVILENPTSNHEWDPSSNSVSHAPTAALEKKPVGEISIMCYEFGPSGQKVHPVAGVAQGYTCRRMKEKRHKSIVLLEAVEDSLLNVIHHFRLRKGFKGKGLSLETAVVNHYKYQAWPEFKAKFRRRVSAYVVDWRKNLNLASRDRTPGLGHEAVEPEGWEQRFCEVPDTRLKTVTDRWFRRQTESGERMSWESL